MQVRPLSSLAMVALALCAVSVLARPDCNACFMKNAAKDLTHNTQAQASASQGPREARTPTESTPTGSSDPLVRSKRTAGVGAANPRAAVSGWERERDGDYDVQSLLRDVMVLENTNTAPGQWWDDSPADVSDSSAKWPYRGRWRSELHVGGVGRGQKLSVPGQAAWGDVTDAMPQKGGQSLT